MEHPRDRVIFLVGYLQENVLISVGVTCLCHRCTVYPGLLKTELLILCIQQHCVQEDFLKTATTKNIVHISLK